MTSQPPLSPELDEIEALCAKATAEQVERANAAVEVNLIDYSPRYGSAQGYACALTAIVMTDAANADTIRQLREQVREAKGVIGELLGPLEAASAEMQSGGFVLDEYTQAAFDRARAVHSKLGE